MSYWADRDSSRMMLSRAEVIETHESEDDLALVTLRGFDGEVLKKVHRLQQFGDAYRPPAGSHGMVLSSGGRRDQALFFGGENHKKRPKDLGIGERVLYNDHGDIIYMHKENIKTTTKLYEVTAETMTFTAETVRFTATNMALIANVFLGGPIGSGKQVHRKDDLDADGDPAVEHASKVWAA